MDKEKKKDLSRNTNRIDLAQFKQLVKGAEESDCSLEEILSEYGSGQNTRRSASSAPSKEFGKVVAFPGTDSPPGPSQTPAAVPGKEDSPVKEKPEESASPVSPPKRPRRPSVREELPEAEETQADSPEESDLEPTSASKTRGFLSALLDNIEDKADRYADQLFEEDERIDPDEVHRLEELIPGTDREEPLPRPRPKRVKKPEPPPPDLPPKELVRTWSKGLKPLHTRSLLVLLLFVAALAQLLCPALGFLWLPPLDDPVLQSRIAAVLTAAGLLLGFDVLFTGIVSAFHLRVGMDTLAAFACLFTLADALALALGPNPPSRLPYTAAALSQIYCLLHGSYHKRCGLRLSCRTAASASSPYRVTLDEGKWNGKDTYCKWTGDAEGFGSQIQMDDGAQRIFSRICPVLLLGAFLLSLLSLGGDRDLCRLLWALSALFTASSALGGSIAYGRSFHKAARRLSQSGGALAGWPGIAGSRRGSQVLLTDFDLFPTGSVRVLNNYKISHDFPSERVIAYTATLIRDSGSGAARPFLDELRRVGGLPRHAENLTFHEAGGISADIRGDKVLVGTASFMKLMEIPISQGLNVRSAVFCAINGRPAGIFALEYNLPDTVFPALEELIGEKVGPVLATRDFNLIPAMLHQRFKLASDRMDFPPVERRRELSDPEQPHSEVLSALLCREGLLPFAEVITAARRLRLVTRMGAVLCCAGSILGLILCSYLTAVAAYTSLSPLSLLVYLLIWLAPVWFLTSWAPRY